MSKVILEFNSPEDHDEIQYAMKGASAHFALEEIRQEIFRPARKHGYANEKIQHYINTYPDAIQLIRWLEEEFNQILARRDIDA